MSRHGKRSGVHVWQEDPFNAEAPLDVLAAEPLTPLDAFYVRGHGSVPDVAAKDCRVRIDGLVERPLEFGLEELRERFARREVAATLQCAGNRRADLVAVRAIPGEIPWGPGTVSTTTWAGWGLADVLGAAGVRPEVSHVWFEGLDDTEEGVPFGGSIPLEKALAPEVLLADTMGGESLPTVHGGPLRVVVPGWVGARSVKWLHRITLAAEPSPNRFQAEDYRLIPPHDPGDPGLPLGELPVNAAILAPAEGAEVPAGRLWVVGYATTSGGRTVARVDVSADGGRSWTTAGLREDQGPWAWRRWEAELDVAPGEAELVARATDSAAGTQPEDPEPLWNAKGYANSAWPRVRVRAD